VVGEAAKVQEGICWADGGLGGSAVHGREECTRDSERRLRHCTAETERQVTASVDVLKERGCRRACVGLRRLRTRERRADHIPPRHRTTNSTEAYSKWIGKWN
jgi:hypothetical protein